MRVPIGVQKAIDKVMVLRQEIKMLKSEEDQLASTIKDFMNQNNLGTIETHTTLAEFCIRSGGVIDPEAYYEALEEDFDKFLDTVSVRKETNNKSGKRGADYYLSIEDIETISIPTEAAVLYIKPLSQKSKSILTRKDSMTA
jgi:hypothetical protein